MEESKKVFGRQEGKVNHIWEVPLVETGKGFNYVWFYGDLVEVKEWCEGMNKEADECGGHEWYSLDSVKMIQ